MRRKLIGLGMLIMLLSGRVHADIPIAFENFLLGIADESSTLMLQLELDRTREEIASLAPQVQELQEAYKHKEETAVSRLMFYNSIGPDVYLQFILGSERIIDAMSNYRIMERIINKDMAELNRFYHSYMLYKTAKDSLERYEIELNMIENNLNARQLFLAEYGHLTAEETAVVLERQWFTEVKPTLYERLMKDSQLLNERLDELVIQRPGESIYWLDEQTWNEYSSLPYFFESSHVYVHYSRDEVDLILIGMVYMENSHLPARLVYEGGFMNGILMPYDYLRALPELTFDFSNFRDHAEAYYVFLMNESILIQPIGR